MVTRVMLREDYRGPNYAQAPVYELDKRTEKLGWIRPEGSQQGYKRVTLTSLRYADDSLHAVVAERAARGDVQALDLILAHDPLLDPNGTMERPALREAHGQEFYEEQVGKTIDVLLRHGADINFQAFSNYDFAGEGLTALWGTVMMGTLRLDHLTALLKRGARTDLPLNCPAQENLPTLAHAVAHGHAFQAMGLLVQHGVEFSTQDLQDAFGNGDHYDRHTYEFVAPSDSSMTLPLLHRIALWHVSDEEVEQTCACIRYLVQKGWDLEERDENGATADQLAQRNSPLLARFLGDFRAQAQAQRMENTTPIPAPRSVGPRL